MKLKPTVILLILFLVFPLYLIASWFFSQKDKSSFQWQVRSVDTMKFSRDLAREKLNDEVFNLVIEEQVKNISQIGATHVAIATPYDEEFLPFLRRWVNLARNYGLKVWFRGNWSTTLSSPSVTLAESMHLKAKRRIFFGIACR